MQGSCNLSVCPHDGSLYSSSELGMWKLQGNTWPVGMTDNPLPYSASLSVYPNPFSDESEIRYAVTVPSRIRLDIYNSSGQKVRMLINDYRNPGSYRETWDGKSDTRQTVPGGIYFGVLNSGGDITAVKLLYLK
jgi:hypothetical protein